MNKEKIAIDSALKMCRLRDSAKRFYREGYEEHVGNYRNYIKACMIKHNICSILEAAIKMADDIKDVEGADIGTMCIFSAALDLIESEESKQDESK